MNRRTLLAGAGSAVTASLAGCVENLVANAGSLGTDDGFATITSASIRTYSPPELSERDSDYRELVFPPSEFDLDVDVDVTTETATSDEPASIEITTWYDGDESVTYSTGGDSYMLPNTISTDWGLELVHEDDTLNQKDDGCWTDSPDFLAISRDDVTLRPGQRNRREFDVVSNGDPCYPTGEHEFVQRYELQERSNTAIYWGIVLELS